MYRFYLALRYVLSRPINLLGMIGIALGVWALIVVIAIFSGYLREAVQHVSGATAEVSVLLASDRLQNDESLEARVLADPSVEACGRRIVWHGLLIAEGSARSRTTGVESVSGVPGADGTFVTVIGVEPESAREVTGLGEWIDSVVEDELRVLEPDALLKKSDDGTPAILVSRARAAAHDLRRGSRLRFSTGRIDGASIERSLEVVDSEVVVEGVFSSGFMGFDGFHVFVDIDLLRELLDKPPDWANELAVELHDGADPFATKLRLYETLNPMLVPGLAVRTAVEANAGELSNIDHQRSLMKLVLFVIMVVAAFLVFATLSMMVTEKTHDIGILTALGASRRGVMTVFLSCGLAIAIAGTVLGVVTGCVSAIYTDAVNDWLRETFGIDLFPAQVYGLSEVPCELDPVWIGQVAVAAIALGIVVAALPAWRAARHDPLRSLRNE